MSEELEPCPRCNGEVSLQRFNTHPSLQARVICSCGIEMRASKGESIEDLTERWNTRHERTCRMTLKSDDCDEIYPVYWYVCSECGKACEGDEDETWYPLCPNCGAKVVG